MIKLSNIRDNKNMNYIVLLAFLTVLILFGTINAIFSLFALAVCCLVIITTSDICYTISILAFLMPMASIFKASPTGSSFFTYVCLLFVLVSFFRKKGKISYLDLSIICFAMMLIVVQSLLGEKVDITGTIKLISNLFLLKIASEVDWGESKNKFLLTYVLGIIISSIIASTCTGIFPINSFIRTKVSYEGMASITRFSGLYEDPNYYAVNLIISLCIIIVLYQANKIRIVLSIVLSVFLVGFAGMTGSKSALLMLIIPLAVFIIMCFHNRKIGLGVISIGIGSGFILLILSNKISIFSNTLLRVSSSNSIGELTTERSSIWGEYLLYFANHFERLFFGNSISAALLNGNAAHNTYIELVYQLGIIGTIWILWIIVRSIKQQNVLMKRTIGNNCILITILMMYFFLGELKYYDPPFHLIICLIVMSIKTTRIKYESEEI